ncbi:recombination-associated protein RdgC [Bordetella hinzii]|nr:Recombination-associated protein RdgC [Bordetella hinzii]KCB26639.1 putative exonuclease, RdgC [Bordetella hinzii L60]MBZ0073655.1 recombination-associated protein RdgC [Bordetella hinzii]MBZ0077869.1 recombination-associated protein RdgC [Bordetella hinzii]MBZ0082452.1 recombination-associated protein RdgC [Bordetella hinzii]
MFKNAKIYRLTSVGPFWDLDELNDALAEHAYVPAGQLQLQSVGWVPPREGAALAHAVGGKLMLTVRSESKLLPGKAINQATAARAREIEEQQGYKPGRKQMKDIRERIIDEKLPTALTQYDDIRLWIDPIERWLIVDTSTPSKADMVISLLAKSIEPFPLENLYVAISPVSAMTGWLAEDEAPANFSIDQDAELRASGTSGAAIRYVKHSIDADDVRRHIQSGKQCTRLAMTWADKISFELTEDLDVRKIRPLDTLKENHPAEDTDAEVFDAEFLLMASEIAKLLAELVYALGGEKQIQESTAAAAAPTARQLPLEGDDDADAGDAIDPLYMEAVTLVRRHGRPSISLIQRHLQIGYNRAAHLLESMELAGLVTPMQSNGSRELRA